MKNILLFLITFCSLAAWSQNFEYEGKWNRVQIQREGFVLTSPAEIKQTIQADIYRKYWDMRWKQTMIPDHMCQKIPGNGNGNWKGFWSTSSENQKMDRLAQAILGIGKVGARQIVNDGFFRSKPNTWQEFADEIRRADNQPDSLGYSREVLEVYGERNRINLGYADRDANINGNGNWEGYWDAGMSEKPYRLFRAIRGLDLDEATLIVKSGYMSYAPQNWKEFVARIIQADRALKKGFSSKILSQFGRDNMLNLGYFDLTACSWVQFYQETLQNTQVTEFDRTEERTAHIQINNSFLLKGEEEKLVLNFNGFEDDLEVTGDYAIYEVRRYVMDDDNVKYVIHANRLIKEPVNVVEVEPYIDNGMLSARITDTGFVSELADTLGDLVVEISVYQSKFFSDKLLGRVEAKLAPDGKMQKFKTNIRPQSGKKAYMVYSIRRVNSDYYSNESSSTIKTDSLRF